MERGGREWGKEAGREEPTRAREDQEGRKSKKAREKCGCVCGGGQAASFTVGQAHLAAAR